MSVVDFLGSQGGRVARIILGLALFGTGMGLGGGWWVMAAIGLLPVVTAVLDVCLFAPMVGRPFTGRAFRGGS
jgi:hypothetical protein